MVFSTSLFLTVFLPVFLILYNIVGKKLKNWVILIASIVFYSWGAPKFVFILIGSTIIDFYLVRMMYQSVNLKRKRALLIISIALNLGLLLYFKYANFFIDNVNSFLEVLGIDPVGLTNVLLPIGISFYTFQTLTYSIDIYRNIHKPLDRVNDYLLYIMSFPQMIAGPIVRFNTIADQIVDRKETVDDKLTGFIRFCIGLAKKVLIANVMGEQADLIMNGDINGVSTVTAWIGILAYTFQIYFDFSGYSDMAIGLGRMMGFKFPENFNNPYISQSITEFWRRWHITLGAWMRDYLYIPLGGSKVSTKRRLYFNLWFVFLVSGLWHGASWSFVVWGAYHGFFLVAERLVLLDVYKKIGKLPSVIITFLIVVVGWVFFRLEQFDVAVSYLGKMFIWQDGNNVNLVTSFSFYMIIAILFSFSTFFKMGNRLCNFVFTTDNYSQKVYYWMIPLGILLFTLSLSSITSTGFNPFIYFRF
jgi:alginate O-acetyltransferase complex protein AlgI